MTKKRFTLVFQVEDEAQFKEFAHKHIENMATENTYQGARVIGAGWDDSMSRADRLAELCEEHGVHIPDDLR